jgi:hypothetical protein
MRWRGEASHVEELRGHGEASHCRNATEAAQRADLSERTCKSSPS